MTSISESDVKILMQNLYELNNLSKKMLQDLHSKNQVICDSINDCKTCVRTLKKNQKSATTNNDAKSNYGK